MTKNTETRDWRLINTVQTDADGIVWRLTGALRWNEGELEQEWIADQTARVEIGGKRRWERVPAVLIGDHL